MKILVWAFPAVALVVQVIEAIDHSEVITPIAEENVWMDNLIPTIDQFCKTWPINEILIIGPITFTEHIQDITQEAFPDKRVLLGEK